MSSFSLDPQYNPFQQRLAQVFSSRQDDCFSFDDFVDLASALCEKAPTNVRAALAFRIYGKRSSRGRVRLA